MSQNEKQKLQIPSVDANEPDISRWLGAIEDCRRRTLRAIEGIGPFEYWARSWGFRITHNQQ